LLPGAIAPEDVHLEVDVALRRGDGLEPGGEVLRAIAGEPDAVARDRRCTRRAGQRDVGPVRPANAGPPVAGLFRPAAPSPHFTCLSSQVNPALQAETGAGDGLVPAGTLHGEVWRGRRPGVAPAGSETWAPRPRAAADLQEPRSARGPSAGAAGGSRGAAISGSGRGGGMDSGQDQSLYRKSIRPRRL